MVFIVNLLNPNVLRELGFPRHIPKFEPPLNHLLSAQLKWNFESDHPFDDKIHFGPLLSMPHDVLSSPKFEQLEAPGDIVHVMVSQKFLRLKKSIILDVPGQLLLLRFIPLVNLLLENFYISIDQHSPVFVLLVVFLNYLGDDWSEVLEMNVVLVFVRCPVRVAVGMTVSVLFGILIWFSMGMAMGVFNRCLF